MTDENGMELPPDTSWLKLEEVSDGPNPLAWMLFAMGLIMALASTALLFGR